MTNEQMKLTVKSLSAETWPDFEALFAKHRGVRDFYAACRAERNFPPRWRRCRGVSTGFAEDQAQRVLRFCGHVQVRKFC